MALIESTLRMPFDTGVEDIRKALGDVALDYYLSHPDVVVNIFETFNFVLAGKSRDGTRPEYSLEIGADYREDVADRTVTVEEPHLLESAQDVELLDVKSRDRKEVARIINAGYRSSGVRVHKLVNRVYVLRGYGVYDFTKRSTREGWVPRGKQERVPLPSLEQSSEIPVSRARPRKGTRRRRRRDPGARGHAK